MSIKLNLEKIQQKIKAASDSVGRDPKEVSLVAVSKRQPLSKIQQAYDLGLRHFGENYIQEAKEKMLHFNSTEIQWHFIGHLQSNKVKEVVGNFSYIHSVDRFSLAQKINIAAKKIGIVQKIFLEVNLAGEESKAGVSESELNDLFSNVVQLEAIKTCGLMIMPPFANAAEDSRQFFSKGNQLLKLLNSNFHNALEKAPLLKELSMGTSQDYEVAIQEGATWIRIGSILLGEREA